MKDKIIIEKGTKFGRLTAIEIIGKTKSHCSIWKCVCDCGNFVNVSNANLKKGNTQSCGCLQKERASEANGLDLLGQRFGRLVVVEKLETIRSSTRNTRWSRYRDWETDRKSTRLNSSHSGESRMPSSA